MTKFISVLTFNIVILTGFLALPCMAAPATETATEVKARLEQRLPQINELKTKGFVGENNAGFLAAQGTTTEAENAVITAENHDRAVVYAAIATKTGTTPEVVGARRAKQIAESATAGTKLQAEDGTWFVKK